MPSTGNTGNSNQQFCTLPHIYPILDLFTMHTVLDTQATITKYAKGDICYYSSSTDIMHVLELMTSNSVDWYNHTELKRLS